jgi:hypothetical protein
VLAFACAYWLLLRDGWAKLLATALLTVAGIGVSAPGCGDP